MGTEPLPTIHSQQQSSNQDAESVSSSEPLFRQNEKVLCYHGPLIYTGKVLRIGNKSTNNQERPYYIHYAGWSKKLWDEYVPESRILKYNDENLQLVKQRKTEFEASSKKKQSGGSGSSKSTGSSTRKNLFGEAVVIAGSSDASTRPISNMEVPSPISSSEVLPSHSHSLSSDGEVNKVTKRKIAPTTSSTDTPAKKKKVDEDVEDVQDIKPIIRGPVRLPDAITRVLMDDWVHIHSRKKLLKLPSRHTVASIIDDYKKSLEDAALLTKTGNNQLTFLDAIKSYFDATLGKSLLYKFEIPQFQRYVYEMKRHLKDMNTDEVRMFVSNIYGPLHLIRLFTKIDFLDYLLKLDEFSGSLLQKYGDDFISLDEYIIPTTDYEVASLNYQQVAKEFALIS